MTQMSEDMKKKFIKSIKRTSSIWEDTRLARDSKQGKTEERSWMRRID